MISEGGLGVALAESIIGSNNLGAEINIKGDSTVELFSESQSRFIVSVCPNNKENFEKIIDAELIGNVTNTNRLIINNDNIQIINLCAEDINKCWKGVIACLVK